MNKYALIIGINNYTHFPKLTNCLNDATDINEFLINHEFKTKLCLDTNQKDLIQIIREFKESLIAPEVSLIYFSGHGLIDDNNNYLVLSDSEIRYKEDIKYNCIHANDFYLNNTITHMHIIILDACRKNMFSDGRKDIQFGLLRMNAPLGTIIAFSTSPNSASIEKSDDRNGIFTKHLLNNFNIPNLPLEQVFKYTRTDVMNETNNKQIPWEESSLVGKNFSFITQPEFNALEQQVLSIIESNITDLRSDKLIAILNSPLSNAISIGYQLLFHTLLQMCEDWERYEIINKTMDDDHLIELTNNYLLPKLVDRIMNDNSIYSDFDINMLDEFKVERNLNYGSNELNPPDETYTQFIANEVIHNSQSKLFSCCLFASEDDKQHILKPILVTLKRPLDVTIYNNIKDFNVEIFLTKYFSIRKPYEKRPDFTNDPRWNNSGGISFKL